VELIPKTLKQYFELVNNNSSILHISKFIQPACKLRKSSRPEVGRKHFKLTSCNKDTRESLHYKSHYFQTFP